MKTDITPQITPIIISSCLVYCDGKKKSKCCKKYKKKGKLNCKRCPKL